MSVIKVENLIKNYKKSTWKESEEDVKVLKGISFQAEQGEFVGIMGKSGCGKTTLLKNLGMIDKPTNGKIQFAGEDTDSLYGDKLAEIRNQKIGFVFQDFYLMDSLSVEENIMLPMILKKSPVKEMQKKAKNLAEQFEIGKLLQKNPYELSGGERQRVAICRALINDPELIRRLIDENVTLEVCVTSNYHTKVVPAIEMHPIHKLLDEGVHVTVNSDNRTCSRTTLQKEKEVLKEQLGFSDEEIEKMQEYAWEARFLK